LSAVEISGTADGALAAGRDDAQQRRRFDMNRKLFWAVLGIGVALVVTPFALSLPTKAAAGERMMTGFQPIMQPDQVAKTATYYNDVFVPLGNVTPMMSAQNLAKFQGYLNGFGAMQAQVDPAVLPMLQQMGRDFGGLLGTMQQNVGIFSQVPAGLAHYQPLVTTMQANVENYEQVNSLPDFRLFTVFFVLPGVLLTGIAVFGLFGDRMRAWAHDHRHPHPTPA